MSRGSNSPRIALVTSHYSYRLKAFLNAATKLKAKVVVVCDKILQDLKANDFIETDLCDPDRSAKIIAEYSNRKSIHAVVAIDDAGATVATKASQLLGLPHNPESAILATNNKYEMRQRFSKAGLPSPEYKLFPSKSNPIQIERQIKYPVVVKPLHLSGSRGVIRANTKDEFINAFTRLSNMLKLPGTGPEPKMILVESYIPGFEVQLEGFVSQGELYVLNIIDKPDPLEGPFFEETILITPSRLEKEIQQRVIEQVRTAIKSLDIYHGPIHAELRINLGKPVLLEIASRSIGGQCSRALKFTGTTLEEIILMNALGIIPKIQRDKKATGVMMIPIPRSGYLKNVSGVDIARKISFIDGVEITFPLNMYIQALPEGSSYLGFIFASGPTPKSVEMAIREAFSQLSIDIDDKKPYDILSIKIKF